MAQLYDPSLQNNNLYTLESRTPFQQTHLATVKDTLIRAPFITYVSFLYIVKLPCCRNYQTYDIVASLSNYHVVEIPFGKSTTFKSQLMVNVPRCKRVTCTYCSKRRLIRVSCIPNGGARYTARVSD